MAKPAKYVYTWGNKKADGDGSMKPLLGGKGANADDPREQAQMRRPMIEAMREEGYVLLGERRHRFVERIALHVAPNHLRQIFDTDGWRHQIIEFACKVVGLLPSLADNDRNASEDFEILGPAPILCEAPLVIGVEFLRSRQRRLDRENAIGMTGRKLATGL